MNDFVQFRRGHSCCPLVSTYWWFATITVQFLHERAHTTLRLCTYLVPCVSTPVSRTLLASLSSSGAPVHGLIRYSVYHSHVIRCSSLDYHSVRKCLASLRLFRCYSKGTFQYLPSLWQHRSCWNWEDCSTEYPRWLLRVGSQLGTDVLRCRLCNASCWVLSSETRLGTCTILLLLTLTHADQICSGRNACMVH